MTLPGNSHPVSHPEDTACINQYRALVTGFIHLSPPSHLDLVLTQYSYSTVCVPSPKGILGVNEISTDRGPNTLVYDLDADKRPLSEEASDASKRL